MTICYKSKHDKKERTSISEVIDIFYVSDSKMSLFELIGKSIHDSSFPIQHYSSLEMCEFVVNYVIEQIEYDKRIIYIPLEEEIKIAETTGEYYIDI